ncbi:FOLATE RECEPTOR-LIKE [Salix viminalis]|uniref:FOLATE RECEPTOR-LIKE n=1 Tax=Salix viminalis TaxID=40686 RepID=A0A9Q0ZID6_SALVM|nr:FOLATE RECEPTOR-LIKE [Salix viminalis]
MKTWGSLYIREKLWFPGEWRLDIERRRLLDERRVCFDLGRWVVLITTPFYLSKKKLKPRENIRIRWFHFVFLLKPTPLFFLINPNLFSLFVTGFLLSDCSGFFNHLATSLYFSLLLPMFNFKSLLSLQNSMAVVYLLSQRGGENPLLLLLLRAQLLYRVIVKERSCHFLIRLNHRLLTMTKMMLLAFSKEWNNLRPHFYKRSQERADSEDDPGKKHNLLRFARKFKEIDEDIQRHNELLGVIKNEPSELSEVVAKRRKDFTKEFFVHLFTVAQSYHDNPSDQNALAKLGNDCVAAVQAYDSATENMEALNAAEIKLQDIINSPSLDAACKKIDDLAEKNKLDSALVLMITKAWSAAKESNMTKDEVKDVLYHLYKTSVANLQRNVPKEIRILKYLLTIEDREERLCALNDAFTQGEELEGKDVDSLYTTPEKLYSWIKVMVDAYNLSQEGTLMREARDLMNPKIIKKMEELKKVVKDHFM